MSWKSCIRTVILALALLAVASCGQIGLGATPQPTQQEMDAFVQAHLATGYFMGAVLVARGDEVLFQGGYGKADLELDAPNTPESVFRLGSLTKQFTAAAILQLQEQGLLDINDTVDRYLPGYPHGDEITIYQLLNHTSGIPDYEFLESRMVYRNAVSLDELMAKFSGLPLDFMPGSQFKYSSSGYVILTAIIEKVSGQSYAEYMAEHIFQPLGMEATRYDNADTVLPGRASGYTWDGDAYHNAEFFDMSNAAGAGGLVSTVGDMYKWDHALYTDAVLSAAAREAYFAPSVSMEEGMSSAYGWRIMDTPEHTLAVHGGQINGFLTFVIRDPATQLYVIVLSNVENIVLSNVENPATVDVAQGLAAIAYGEPYDMPGQPPAVEVVEVDPAVLQKYAGSYQFSADMTLTITAEAGHLFAEVPNQPKFEIFPTSETDFFAKIADIKLHFEVDADGAVTELVIHEGGQEKHAAKVK